MKSNYKICNECVMDTSDPLIYFDNDGVCNHCRDAKFKLAKGLFSGDEGLNYLNNISNEILKKGKNSDYDCIIGVSGGVDSSYLLHFVKVDLKLNPLVVHVDAGWNSELAVSNIESMVTKLNLDLYTFVVDWREIKALQLAFLNASLANQDVPQDHAFFAKLYQVAESKSIKYVITGSNLSSESILPRSWGYSAMDLIQIKSINKTFGNYKLKNYPMCNYFKYKIYYPYILKMKVIRPLNYMNYNKLESKIFLQNKYGWRDYGGKHHESIWTKFFQSYYLPEKFGFDKRKAHLSSMIVAKQITREEALIELEKPLFDSKTIDKDIRYIEKKLGIESGRMLELMKLDNKDYTDYPNQLNLDNVLRYVKRFISGKLVKKLKV